MDVHVEVPSSSDEKYLEEHGLPKHGSGRFFVLFFLYFAYFILLIFLPCQDIYRYVLCFRNYIGEFIHF